MALLDPLLQVGTTVKKIISDSSGTTFGNYIIVGKRFVKDGKAFDYAGVPESEGLVILEKTNNIVAFNHFEIEEVIVEETTPPSEVT